MYEPVVTLAKPQRPKKPQQEVSCPECGCVWPAEMLVTSRKQRSNRHNSKFHCVIEAAFEHWPHESVFTPGNKEELRAWLLYRAGHHTTVRQKFETAPGIRAIAEFTMTVLKNARNTGGFAFVEERAGELVAFVPRSIKYEETDQTEFQPVCESVFADIERILGIGTVDELYRGHIAKRRASRAKKKEAQP